MPQHWPQVLPLVRCSNGTRGCSELSQNRNPAMCPDESCANRWIVYLPWPTSVSLCMCLCLCVGIFALLHTRTGAHISTRAGRFRPLPHTLSTLLGQIHPFGATDRSTHTNTHTANRHDLVRGIQATEILHPPHPLHPKIPSVCRHSAIASMVSLIVWVNL